MRAVRNIRACYDRLTRSYLDVRRHVLPVTVGPWSYNRRPEPGYPSQGWKLHVSATILTAARVLRRARRILDATEVVFKAPRNLDVLIQINSGLNYSQVGKFLTVYASDVPQAVALASRLHAATRDFDGPEIPFDSRYRSRSSVYYRYGSYLSASGDDRDDSIVDSAGNVRKDRRGYGRAVPPWIRDPFGRRPRRISPLHSRGPIGHEYVVFRALSQRGKGGVYEALDLRHAPARVCILKEGRRAGETYWDGSDGVSRLRCEAAVLKHLRASGIPVPSLYRAFRQDGHAYLVLEKVEGRLLLPRGAVKVRRPSWPRSGRLVRRLSELLHAIHATGWVWRDCKPDNLICVRGRFRPLDFEGACRQQDTHVAPWGAPQYTPPPIYNSFQRPPGVAEDDYALAVIAFQFGTGRLPPRRPAKRRALLERTRCPGDLRSLILRGLEAAGSTAPRRT